MMDGAFEDAANGPIVLNAVVKTNKPLLDTASYISQSQSNFTT